LTVTKCSYLNWQQIFYYLRRRFLFSITAQDFYRTWLYIWVTWRVIYKKQELLTLREHLRSPSVFLSTNITDFIQYISCYISTSGSKFLWSIPVKFCFDYPGKYYIL
jgi:hypothetical protein